MRKQTSQFPNPKKRPTIIPMQNGMYEKKGHKFDIYVINKSTKSKCQIPQGELSLKKKRGKKKSSPNSQTTHKDGKKWEPDYISMSNTSNRCKGDKIYYTYGCNYSLAYHIPIGKDSQSGKSYINKNSHFTKLLIISQTSTCRISKWQFTRILHINVKQQ